MSGAADMPATLAPRTRKIMFEDFELMVDIGFHEAEIGRPQRIVMTIEIWLEEAAFARSDRVEAAWNYDHIHRAVRKLAAERRYNLQETLAREVYALVAREPGVIALRVATRKPDIYPDCGGVGVDLSSF